MRITLFVLSVCLLGTSCSYRYYTKRGERLYESGRVYKSTNAYGKAFNKTKRPELRSRAALAAGQACEGINKIPEAYGWYRRMSQADRESGEPLLKMAEMKLRSGEYEEALENYRKFNDLFPDDERGTNGISNTELLQKESDPSIRYEVEIQRELNSRNSDFGPVFDPSADQVLYFTSARKMENRKRGKTSPVTGDFYAHIYKTEFTQEIQRRDKKGVIKTQRFPEPRWLKPEMLRDSIASNRDDGGLCFTPDGSSLYFTSSRSINLRSEGTRIYKAGKEQDEYTGEEKWNRLSKSGICGDTVSVGHPAVTPDGSRLYFVSDRIPGGMGGRDIWYVEGADGRWGEPQNAGDLVNTEGDELFPSVRENGELYFASNGHAGLGGLDLYKITEEEGVKRRVHLPPPLNSYADDFGITFRTGRDEGFFSSTRGGRTDDIYHFAYIPQKLKVRLLVINKITELPVERVEIAITADDGSTAMLETDTAGRAEMEMEPQREYLFAVTHPRYLVGKTEVSTYRERGDRMYEEIIELQPIERPIVIPNIYFDLGKWDLRQDAMDNLQELLTILKDNPNITIELSAHTDMIGDDRSNRELSEKRANAVVDYLIDQGVNWDRLQAKGYGESQPRRIDEKAAKESGFLKPGDVLTEAYINRLRGDARETALQLNRRIEFKVLNTNYRPGPNSKVRPARSAAVSGNGTQTAGQTGVSPAGRLQIRELKDVKGHFFTLQLGVFRKKPTIIDRFKVVFTEPAGNGTLRYTTGIYDTREEAAAAAGELKAQGVDCFIKEYTNR